MKTVLNLFIIVVAAFTFAACEKANNPVSASSVDKQVQNYSGTFEVTYKDYKNTSQAASFSGTLNLNFSTNTYTYEGVLVSSDNQLSQPVHDMGTYSIRGNNIEMYDNATKQMNPIWQPSLYLSGIYDYRNGNDQVTINGEGQYGTIRIVLIPQ